VLVFALCVRLVGFFSLILLFFWSCLLRCWFVGFLIWDFGISFSFFFLH